MIDASEIKIRPAVKADTIAVADVLRFVGLTLPPKENTQMVIDHWERLWDNNPSYKEVEEEIFYGWVLEHHDKIVGFFGFFPRVYYLNGKKISIMIATNWGILKPYRSFTSMLCDAFFLTSPNRIKLATTAIIPTGKIYERYGGKRFPDQELNHAFLIPFRLEKMIRFKFARLPWLYSFAKPVLLLSNYLLPSSFQCRLFWKNRGLTEIKIEDLPDDFEAFWHEYLRQSKGFIASRGAEVMKWVYADIKKENRKRLFIYRSPENNNLLGYASLIIEPVAKDPEIKRYKIGDILALTDEIKKQLIKQLISYAYHDNADLMEIHLVGTITRKDIPTYNILRTTPSFPVYYQTADKELDVFLSDRKNWNFTPYDGDTILG